MTLDEIKSSDKHFLLASEVAEILGTNPNTVRLQAHCAPEMLGFPVIVMGSRVKIPRIPFLNFMLGQKELNNVCTNSPCA